MTKSEYYDLLAKRRLEKDKLFEQRQHDIEVRERRRNFNYGVTSGFKILGLLISFLLILALFGALTGSEPFSFKDLLNVLRDAPQVDFNWLDFSNLTIDASSWGVFAFLANFINSLMGIVEIALFICTALFQVIRYVIYFLKVFFFGGV